MSVITLATTETKMVKPFDSQEFNDLLVRNNAFVAGSFALCEFLNDSDNYTPGDLDIWVPINPGDKCTWIPNPDYDPLSPYSNKICQDMSVDKFKSKSAIMSDVDKTFLTLWNYNRVSGGKVDESSNYKYLNNRFSKHIHTIHNYEHVEKRKRSHLKIQVIYINIDRDALLQTFDLSFCATVWDGKEFYTLEPELTTKKIGYKMNNVLIPKYNAQQRLKKYLVRGFTIYETKEEAMKALNPPLEGLNIDISYKKWHEYASKWYEYASSRSYTCFSPYETLKVFATQYYLTLSVEDQPSPDTMIEYINKFALNHKFITFSDLMRR